MNEEPNEMIKSSAPKPIVENVAHFLSECHSVESVQLRRELCVRLRRTTEQWQSGQRDTWAAEWKGPLSLLGPNDPLLLERSRTAELTNGVKAIAATLTAMERRCGSPSLDPTDALVTMEVHPGDSAAMTDGPLIAPASHPPVDGWSELLLGRCMDPVTGRQWDRTLLTSIQRVTQNYLLLLWRLRASRLGGVPTLLTGGRGITMIPYRRMKTIGVRQVSQSRGERSTQVITRMSVQLSSHC